LKRPDIRNRSPIRLAASLLTIRYHTRSRK